MTRPQTVDALFMIAYIGFSAAMATLTLTLAIYMLLDLSLSPAQVGAAVLNVLGWSVLPFAPRLYRARG